MPDAIITSTESTFGTISGTFAADQSTITGTVTGIVAGTLSGSVGVPGPAGPGVPAGGTAGQILQKIDGVDYNTDWVTASFSATWGSITGTLSSQTDLQTALNLKAPLASPALTGVPTTPTAATLTSTTQIASTAFVQQELASGTAVAKNLEVYVRNQTGSTLAAGAIVYINGATGNRPTVTLAQANNDANSAQTFGFVKAAIANNGFGYVIVRGECENLNTSALTEGAQLYLSPTTPGAWTTTKPSAPQHLVYVGIVVRAHPNQGVILVAVQNGYELDELHDVSIVSKANNDLIAYDSATNLWKNKSIGTLGLATQAWVDAQGYLQAGALTGYALESWVTAGFYPLTGNPSGFLTSASLTGYATESWVTSQGYITSAALSPYLLSSTAASTYQTIAGMSSYLTTSAAASTYAPIASPTFTGLSTFNNPGNYAITIDNTTGYYTSISSGVYSIFNASTEVIRLSSSGVKYPDGVTQSVAYPGPSGFLLKADNLSGLANTATARTNLGLGTMATESASNYLTTSAAASTYLTQSSAASTYYLQTNPAGYITSSALSPYLTTATAASTYAPLASPALTGNPTAPTPATADNDTSIATTAFVKAQGYLTSAPVTSVAGRTGAVTLAVADISGAAPLASPALTGTPTAPTATAGTNTTQIATTAFVTAAVPAAATLTDSRQLTNDTKAMSPLDVRWSLMTQDYIDIDRLNFTYTTTGTPQWNQVGSITTNSRLNATVASSVIGRPFGTSQVDQVSPFLFRNNWTSNINFNLKTHLSGRAGSFSLLTDATFNQAFYYGKVEGDAIGDLTRRGFGWRWTGGAGSRFVNLVVHNGTTQTTVASSFAVTQEVAFDWDLYSDGAGNVTLYINGTQVATSNAGPTSYQSAGTYAWWREEAWTTAAPSFGNHTSYFRGGRAAILNY